MNKFIKRILLIVLICSFNFIKIQAQQFALYKDTLYVTTTGHDNFETIDIANYIFNTHDSAIRFDWRLLNPEAKPLDWNFIGFCDNMLCYTSGWQSGQTNTSGWININDNSVFKLMLNIPTNATNTTAIFAFEVKNESYVDTAYFHVTKNNTTGVYSSYASHQNIISYPNPTGNVLNITSDKLESVKSVKVWNLQGQTVLIPAIISDKQISISLTTLFSGTYIFHLIDKDGDLIGSGKFIKK